MQEIGKFQKNALEIIKAQTGEYNNRPVIDFRVWVENQEGKFIPTKKGLTFSPGNLKDFFELVKKVYEQQEKKDK